MAKKSVCISFDYTEDGNYRNILKAWNDNPEIDFKINDKTPNEINSYDISVIKSVLSSKINSADYMLVIVGRKSNSPHPDRLKIGKKNWQNWEIEKAKELKKKIVAVKIDWQYESPDALIGAGAKWAHSFTKDVILSKLNES